MLLTEATRRRHVSRGGIRSLSFLFLSRAESLVESLCRSFPAKLKYLDPSFGPNNIVAGWPGSSYPEDLPESES
jgi:hypothetical protein